VQITVSDGSFAAYVAYPDDDGKARPAVVVVQEIFGVNADVRTTCDELAQAGFVAIAPDLFWREEPGLDLNSWSEQEWARALELYGRYDIDRGVLDLAATIDAARSLVGTNGLVGITGFCMGGLLTFLAAARTDVDAAASYYGGNTELYLEEANDLAAPLILHLAEEDEFMSKDAQASIRAALRSKQNVSVFTYAGCSHAFARHTGLHYDAAAASLANERTRTFLSDHLEI
jgi:carboxymethylenebutenolidase